MQLSQGNTKRSLENAQGFLRANTDAIGDAVPQAALQRLDEAIAGLTGHASAQNAHTRAAAGALEDRRRKQVALVRDHMRPIAKIAALELQHEGKLIAFTLPRKHVSVEQLAALATGMAEAAAPHASVFVAAGLKPDFAEQLKTAASVMLGLTAEYKQNKYTSREAATSLRTQLSRGRKMIHMVDALLQSALADRPGLLDAWNMARRVHRKGYPSAPVTPVVQASPGTPASPATATSVAA